MEAQIFPIQVHEMDRRVHSGGGDVPVTVRVTTLKGAAAGAYYVEALPNYYLDADEPRGIWHGQAAGMLGLSGTVDDEAFLALMAGLDPRDPERLLGNGYSETSVRGFDVTASSPKSVSVLWAVGDDWVRAEVLAAHDAAVAAVAGWIEAHAHTRFRMGGEVVVVDAEGIVAAGFRQHTSRALDPQLHTHLVVANRVKSPDGRWLALDARTLKRDQRTLSALFHAAERAELTRRLGVEWGPVVNGIAEIDGIDRRVIEEFSTRTKAVNARLSVKLDRFEQTMGREPTQRERWQLEREAAVDSRPAKDHAVNADILHERWVGQLRDLGVDPEQLVAGVIGRSLDAHRDVGDLDPLGSIDAAIDALAEQQSSWRPAEIVRELAAQFPTTLAATADEVVGVADLLGYGIGAGQGMELGPPAPAGVERRVSDDRPITEVSVGSGDHPMVDPRRGSVRPRLGRPWHRPHPAPVEPCDARAVPDRVLERPAGSGRGDRRHRTRRPRGRSGRDGQDHRDAPGRRAAPCRGAGGVRCRAVGDRGVGVLTWRRGCGRTRSTSSSPNTAPAAPNPTFDLPPGATVIVDEAGMLATPEARRTRPPRRTAVVAGGVGR